MESRVATAESAALKERFAAIDWSFSSSAADPVHAVHPYPAKFIPEIPGAALSLAPEEGLILDPFCGVGTTLIESVRRGRSTVGMDLNPIATLVARATLGGWSEQDAEDVHGRKMALLAAAAEGSPEVLADARATVPRLDHWFDPVAQRALAGVVGLLRTLDADDPWRTRLAAATSSVVVRVSRQESDTRYAAIEKQTSLPSILAALDRAVDKVARAAFVVSNETKEGVKASVITDDVTTLSEHVGEASVACTIFSPPYPNAYEYWLYHKYRMYWLGFDPIAVRGREIGARPFYSGSGKLTEDDFANQMQLLFADLHRAIKPGGTVVVVIGDSVIRGRFVDNASLLSRVATTSGFLLIADTVRTIRPTRKSFNLAVARAREEKVLLFLRP